MGLCAHHDLSCSCLYAEKPRPHRWCVAARSFHNSFDNCCVQHLNTSIEAFVLLPHYWDGYPRSWYACIQASRNACECEKVPTCSTRCCEGQLVLSDPFVFLLASLHVFEFVSVVRSS